jgi:acyl-CoA synthetase (AMP-forming)/AMP-acid ligase II
MLIYCFCEKVLPPAWRSCNDSLRKLGMVPCSYVRRTPYWFVSNFYASAKTERNAGVIVSAAAPTYLVDEMVHAMKPTRPKLLVVDSASYKEAIRAAKKLGLRETNIICTESVGGLPSIPDLITEIMNSGAKQVARWELSKAQTSQNTCALICFSSGTTGLPKAVGTSWNNPFQLLICAQVMISNANLIAQSCQVKTNRGSLVRGPLFSPLPLYHSRSYPCLLQNRLDTQH